jgi:DNA replicative helicase MCM subunit Mcm2 (Cdc46/Mcm family)
MEMKNNAVKTIQCQDCGKNFVFTDKEQEFYKEKGFVTPKRCKSCRNARKNKERRV